MPDLPYANKFPGWYCAVIQKLRDIYWTEHADKLAAMGHLAFLNKGGQIRDDFIGSKTDPAPPVDGAPIPVVTREQPLPFKQSAPIITVDIPTAQPPSLMEPAPTPSKPSATKPATARHH